MCVIASTLTGTIATRSERPTQSPAATTTTTTTGRRTSTSSYFPLISAVAVAKVPPSSAAGQSPAAATQSTALRKAAQGEGSRAFASRGQQRAGAGADRLGFAAAAAAAAVRMRRGRAGGEGERAEERVAGVRRRRPGCCGGWREGLERAGYPEQAVDGCVEGDGDLLCRFEDVSILLRSADRRSV